jgi:CRP-like cAMP-binding protein
MRRRNNSLPEFDSFTSDYNEVIKGEYFKKPEKIIQFAETEGFSSNNLINGECARVFQGSVEPKLDPSKALLFPAAFLQKEFQSKQIPTSIIVFEILINLCIIYSVCESLNDLSFKVSYSYKSIISELIWGLFIIDFISNFFINKRKANLTFNKKYAIFNHYLKTWAFFDFITLIPFRFTGNPNTESFCKLLRVFKSNRFFQMINMKNFARYCIKKIKSTEQRYPRIELIIELIWNWVIIVLSMFFLAFTLACIWWYYSDLFERHNFTQENFISTYDIEKLETNDKVIKTMYFITTSLLTVGYGDMSATNIYEMGFCCLLVTVGASIFAYTMSLAGNYINALSKLLKKNKNELALKKLIGTIESFKGFMPIILQFSIMNFFNYFWKNDRLGTLAKKNNDTNSWKKFMKRNDQYFKKLPTRLKKNILDILFNDVFRHFRYLFPEKNEFRYYMCTFFLPRIFQCDMFLVKENEKCDEIFLVKSGNVQLCFEDLGDSLVKCKTFTGWFTVGEYCVVMERKSFATFMAESEVEALAIPAKAFKMIILRYYPAFLQELKRVVKRRTTKLLDLMRIYGYDSYHKTIKKLYKNESNMIHSSIVPRKEVTLMEIYQNAIQQTTSIPV